MDKSLEKGPTTTDLEELTILLADRTFVDYFNIFLCLPVFGQHVFYNFLEMEFQFEPPVRNRRNLYMDRREVLKWLHTERFRYFKKSALYIDYHLVKLLRDSRFELKGLDLENTINLTKNVIGTATGMTLFRESMRGTCGENVFRCLRDLEAWKQIEDPVRKIYWKRVVKTQYIDGGSKTEIPGNSKVNALYGILKFDLVPDKEIQQQLIESVTDTTFQTMVDSDHALLNLHTILLAALRTYWLPRHLLHIINVLNEEVLDVLKRPAPGDFESVVNARWLRCQYQFPTILQDSRMTSLVSSESTTSTETVPASSSNYSQMSFSSFFEAEEQAAKKINPMDFLSLCGGPVKMNQSVSNSPSYVGTDSPLQSEVSSPFLPEINSHENGSGDMKMSSTNFDTLTDGHVKSAIPTVLSSYLCGKKRSLLWNLPTSPNWMVWCLASDMLACCPFRTFLQQHEQYQHEQYLGFWTDIRNYLDTDDHVLDGYGRPVREQLVQRIIKLYLSEDGAGRDIFKKKLKKSLIQSLTTYGNVSVLCAAQETVQGYLWEPLKLFIQKDRDQFLQQIQGQRKRLKSRQDVTSQMSLSDRNSVNSDPMILFKCATLDTETELSSPFSPFSSTMSYSSATSRPPTTCHVSISEEQKLRAMELAVLCSEYGMSMMKPENIPNPSKLVDVLLSDYGSLHVSRDPTVRHEWLRNLREKPKINIETIKVSREVLLEKIDISKLKQEFPDEVPTNVIQRGPVQRRTGMSLDRPKKPKSLMEALSTPVQYEYFKRYMLIQNMSLPVVFWRAVEDLQMISNSKTRQIKVNQILRKFFGNYAKFGYGLDCDEEIIRQIPNMQNVSPGILICAQAAVFRSLERKWYPKYVATFPTDSESSSQSSSSIGSYFGIMRNFGETVKLVTKAKKLRKQRAIDSARAMAQWLSFSKGLADFVKAMGNKAETQLFHIFLKYEVEKEKQNSNIELDSQFEPMERNITMSSLQSNVTTRVVIRNRLIIMNRLPSDLLFWVEIMKYQSLYDTATRKIYGPDKHSEFLTDKARSIISCFLASEVLPKVQVNIPNDMALNITNSLASDGPKRGLFHDAVVLLFPIMHHFYRRFCNEWMAGDIPDDFFDNIECVLKNNVGSTPHEKSKTADFTTLTTNQIKLKYKQSQDDSFNIMKIHFSIVDGVTMTYPQEHQRKSPAGTSTSSIKSSTHVLKPDSSLIKGSKGGRGDRKDSKQSLKTRDKDRHAGDKDRHAWNKYRQAGDIDRHAGDKDGKMRSTGSAKNGQKSKKIVVKDAYQLANDSPKIKDGSMDKAKKLSALVESLNKQRDVKIKEQNKKFSKLMSFSQFVSAVVAQPSDTSSETETGSSNHASNSGE